MRRWRGVIVAGVVASLAWLVPQSFGQVVPVPIGGRNAVVGGVYVDPDGALRAREQDAKELDALRAKVKDKAGFSKLMAAPDGAVTCVSLPRAFAKAKEAIDAGKPVPDDIKYLAGLTRIRYVFVYPEEKDLVIAGPAEPFDAAANPAQPLGKTTGRPVLHIEDLVVALRSTQLLRNGGGFIGCSIDNKPGGLNQLETLIAKYQNGPRETMKQEIAKASPPQTVSVIGVPGDSRLALALVAADYKLKTICMNIESTPITEIGHIVSDERTSAARLWYELSYHAMAVSKDSNAYELRGQRVKVLAGSQMYDARGATRAAEQFAEHYSKHMEELAALLPAIADLQNVADQVMLASLIQSDKLDTRVAWDTAWLFDLKGFPTASYNVPKTTPTLVGITGKSVVRGGVSFMPGSFLQASSRAVAEKDLPMSRPAEGQYILPPAK